MIVYIISGVSRGLGFALVENILKENNENNIVIGLSRNEPTSLFRFTNNFEWVKIDFKYPEQIILNLDPVLRKYEPTKICFISNAGDINPIAKIGNIKNFEMVESLSVNIISPANCINYLLENYSHLEKLLLINVSSGAADKAIKGWSLYNSAKAYMKIYFDVLAIELMDDKAGRILVSQFDPGAMDTVMQAEIRNSNIPSEQIDRLKNLYESNDLKQPKDVAELVMHRICKLL